MPGKIKESRQTQIMIVDDHPVVRKGVRLIIENAPDLCVCGEAENIETACDMLKSLDPDMLVVDISLGTQSGLELIHTVRDGQMKKPILVLSMHDEATYAERAIKAGARGYITKQEAPDLIVKAIRDIIAGKIFISGVISKETKPAAAAETGLDDTDILDPAKTLSAREMEVFTAMAKGMATASIAESIGISLSTTETHICRIRQKLTINDIGRLRSFAATWLTNAQSTTPPPAR